MTVAVSGGGGQHWGGVVQWWLMAVNNDDEQRWWQCGGGSSSGGMKRRLTTTEDSDGWHWTGEGGKVMISVVRRRLMAVDDNKDINDGGKGRTTAATMAWRLGGLAVAATEGSGGQQ